MPRVAARESSRATRSRRRSGSCRPGSRTTLHLRACSRKPALWGWTSRRPSRRRSRPAHPSSRETPPQTSKPSAPPSSMRILAIRRPKLNGRGVSSTLTKPCHAPGGGGGGATRPGWMAATPSPTRTPRTALRSPSTRNTSRRPNQVRRRTRGAPPPEVGPSKPTHSPRSKPTWGASATGGSAEPDKGPETFDSAGTESLDALEVCKTSEASPPSPTTFKDGPGQAWSDTGQTVEGGGIGMVQIHG